MKTVAILSQKGGTGKTTLSLHLAVAAEQAGKAAVVIDLDPQASAMAWKDIRKADTPEVVSIAPGSRAIRKDRLRGVQPHAPASYEHPSGRVGRCDELRAQGSSCNPPPEGRLRERLDGGTDSSGIRTGRQGAGGNFRSV